jgi:hypothetical protein
VNEIIPLCSGALLGLLAARLRPSQRLGVVVSLSILLGVGASAVTGELSIGWEYLLVDIPLVALSAGICFVAWSRRRRSLRGNRYA